ncbi:MAG: hypothetical protein ACODAC_01685 [Pseudomonadota bacterium]
MQRRWGPGRPAAWLGAVLTALAAGCHSEHFRSVDLTPPARITAEVPESQVLDVGIAVFDPNVPEGFEEAQQRAVNPEVRRAESYYVPFMLKRVLESTGNWGAVRVVPGRTFAVDLLVTGRIVRSQGERQVIEIEARDATGTLWLEKTYETLASKYAYQEGLPRGTDPFQPTYTRIADDLAASFVALNDAERVAIRRTAELRYAEELLPAAFEEYVEPNARGRMEVRRLPARDDPAMRDVRKVREREFMFIDTLDAYYAEYNRRVRPIYDTWRQASYSEVMAREELEEKRRRRVVAGALSILGGLVGGPATMSGVSTGAELLKDAFTTQDEAEMHAQALREVSASMEGEVMPHTLELENRTVELTGSVEQQYEKLRAALREDYRATLGLGAQ